MPTLRQERLAEALLDPSITTKTAALLASGYSAKTADRTPGRIAGAIGVRHARNEIEARRRDSARVIAEKASRQVIERLDTMPDAAVVLAWKTAEELKSGEPEVEARFLPPSYLRDRRRRKAYKHWLNGAKAALLAIDSGNIAAFRERLITAHMSTQDNDDNGAFPPSPPHTDEAIIDAELVTDTATAHE